MRHDREWQIVSTRVGWALLWIVLAGPAWVFGEPPHWIGRPERTSAGESFRRPFTLGDSVHFAVLKFAADFCSATVEINGTTVLRVDPFSPTHELEVTHYLRRGANELSITTRDGHGPAAIALSLVMLHPEDRRTTMVTDGSWTTGSPDRREAAADLGPLRPEMWGLGRRAVTISPLENYEQWQQTKRDSPARQPKLWTVPGFEITTLRVAQPEEGSWISLAFDPQGRATISREDRGLLRMTLADDRSSVARVEAIDVDLKEVRGLLYAYGWLYANANGSQGMYRLRLAHDGRAEDIELLRKFPGAAGHGRNDLTLGPDGLIYSIHGDAVAIPTEHLLDRTSPLRESRRGKPRHEGYLIRTDRDGQQWEVVCTGLRNPYGLAFNAAGDLFTYDADNEFDMGTPWYRPTRMLQLMSGADYGYRVAKGLWPPEYPDHPDNGLPTIDVGRGSPTAVMSGAALKFPDPYRQAMLILDWTYGRVLAMHLAPHGAGYRASLELFLQGQPLNVTDLAAGPDGALYLITGGRKTQSTLYRVAYVGQGIAQSPESRHDRQAREYSEQQCALRTELEAFHGQLNPAAVPQAWPHLSSDDPAIQHAARIAVEQQPPAQWQTRALASQDYRTQLSAWMAVARTGDPQQSAELVALLLQTPIQQLNLGRQFALMHLYRLCWQQAPEAVRARRLEVVQQLAGLWPDEARQGVWISPYGSSVELRRRLALLLSDLGDPGIIERTAPLLASERQEDRFQGLLALRARQADASETRQRNYFSVLRDGANFSGGQGMPSFLDRLRTDALATLTEPQKSALAEVLAPAAAAAEESLPPPRPVVRKWTSEQLAALVTDSATPGDPIRGAAIFREALCNRCHRSGLVGPAVGPDLTFVARRFSRRDMLESILTPSRVVAENYRKLQVTTTTGQTYVGRLLTEGDFRSEKLRMNVDPLRSGSYIEIDKKEIEASQESVTSPMPKGLLDSFTPTEIAALLAFLEQAAAP